MPFAEEKQVVEVSSALQVEISSQACKRRELLATAIPPIQRANSSGSAYKEGGGLAKRARFK